MSFETILTDTEGGVLTITMNRPERLNAWTPRMSVEMSEAIEAANADDDIVGIVLTGAGRGFCAGADIGDVFKEQAEGRVDVSRPRTNWVDLVRQSKPMVAAINGAAIGVGLTQALPMDLLIATPQAKLSARFVKMGLVPELASSYFLPMRVGFGCASDLMLTGKTVLGEEALAMRLVDRVVPADALLQEARTAARAMGENPLAAVRIVKQLLTENAACPDTQAVQKREVEALRECYKSPEHKEAIAAFLEKRTPDFKRARSGG